MAKARGLRSVFGQIKKVFIIKQHGDGSRTENYLFQPDKPLPEQFLWMFHMVKTPMIIKSFNMAESHLMIREETWIDRYRRWQGSLNG